MNWKTTALVLGVLIVGVAILAKMATRLPAPPDHQVFINGDVLTMDASSRIVEAVSVRGERIEAVGSTDEIMALVSNQTEVVDLRGRTLMPGFIDAHGHFPGSGMSVIAADLTSPPVGNKQSMEEVLAALKERAASIEPGKWVSGFGYDDTLLAEQRHPTRAELDEVSTEHPVVAMHVSGHMVVVNSMALELVGISAETENPVGGVIARREGSREPNGLLEENARLGVVDAMQDTGALAVYQMIKTAVRDYAQVGVTTAQSGGTSVMLSDGLSLFSKLGVIPQRLVLFAFDTEFAELIDAGEFDPQKYHSDRVRMPAVKLVADGSIQGYTGYLSHPYHMPFKGDESYRGYPSISREVLFDRVQRLHGLGYQLAIHGNGDESIEDILDAFEAAQQAHPRDDARMILIHSQMAREDQIARMKGLGVTPSFFSAHTYYWGDRHRDIFMGPERAAAMSPARWAQQYKLRFSSHMDTPVTPMLPLQAVWSQVYRLSYGGDVIGEDQRIDVMSALRAVTIDAAWQVFQEDRVGSLEAGKLADMIILSASPLANPMSMRDLKVERTLIGGATIYRRQ
ncbi:amidohydrolase [Halieaceae bacterium IMCC8485]|jgi:predicted amidohydrolase YtcJ|uniref:Amidohydrolase n=1 Tax=Candidatus Seongchinamella marina TaxID=2518990 RepID=A0ABT3SU82_9GAMM|nr:amidohydrolase [Candidatus Seongchinamella marina]MCX2973552.1 amidohydrolase [Candidatus Seongchinamella marina]